MNKINCRHENNLICFSPVDENNEDWTGWLGWKPRIGELSAHITP